MEEFENLKGEYSRIGIQDDERKIIEQRMRENLKKRTTEEIVIGLDGNSYCIDSCDYNGLLLINAALRNEVKRKGANAQTDILRQKQLRYNKYSPKNPYYGPSEDVTGLNEDKDL